MRDMKLVALPMLLIAGLLVTGVGYACWSQTIYAKGTVASGDLCWEFTACSVLDTSGNDYHCYENFEDHTFWMGDKDVGSSSCEIVDPHTVEVTLNNVYPCYFTSVSVYAHNCGSTPFFIENVVIDGVVLTELPTPVVKLDLDNDGLDDIEIWWGNAIGEQVDPCEVTPEMSFWIHVLQEAPQGATLQFTISLNIVQWNESSHWTGGT